MQILFDGIIYSAETDPMDSETNKDRDVLFMFKGKKIQKFISPTIISRYRSSVSSKKFSDDVIKLYIY